MTQGEGGPSTPTPRELPASVRQALDDVLRLRLRPPAESRSWLLTAATAWPEHADVWGLAAARCGRQATGERRRPARPLLAVDADEGERAVACALAAAVVVGAPLLVAGELARALPPGAAEAGLRLFEDAAPGLVPAARVLPGAPRPLLLLLPHGDAERALAPIPASVLGGLGPDRLLVPAGLAQEAGFALQRELDALVARDPALVAAIPAEERQVLLRQLADAPLHGSLVLGGGTPVGAGVMPSVVLVQDPTAPLVEASYPGVVVLVPYGWTPQAVGMANLFPNAPVLLHGSDAEDLARVCDGLTAPVVTLNAEAIDVEDWFDHVLEVASCRQRVRLRL